MADETNAGGLSDELLPIILAAAPGTPTLTCRKIAEAVAHLIAAREVEAGRQALRDAADEIVDEMGAIWGGDRAWLTTGTKNAALMADVLRARADGLGGTP